MNGLDFVVSTGSGFGSSHCHHGIHHFGHHSHQRPFVVLITSVAAIFQAKCAGRKVICHSEMPRFSEYYDNSTNQKYNIKFVYLAGIFLLTSK